MPIYEYECQACAHRFEEWQKMSDKPIKVCPKCKARKVDKLISHTSFQLKGSGWYSDLYASPKPSAPPSSTEGAATAGAASGKEKSPSPSASSSGAAGTTAKTTETKSKVTKGGAKAAA